MIYFFPLLLFLFFIFLSKFFVKKNFLLNFTGDKHQIYISNKKIPLLGGSFFLLIIFYLPLNITVKIFSLGIYLIGLFSDYKIIKSANLRFIIQIILITIFLYLTNLFLGNTRVKFLDILLENKFFNIFFTAFCILIVVNGSNFIDGVNLNSIIYFFLINFLIYNLTAKLNIYLDKELFLVLNLSIVLIMFLNYSNVLYLGDNGSYLFGFFYSFLLIHMYINNNNISPFFIILILWYPCFENLFSILRKYRASKSPSCPDVFHLHHLIFYFFSSLKKTKNISKNLSGFSINIYNALIFFLAQRDIFNSQYQIILIIISLLIYCFVYYILINFKKNDRRN